MLLSNWSSFFLSLTHILYLVCSSCISLLSLGVFFIVVLPRPESNAITIPLSVFFLYNDFQHTQLTTTVSTPPNRSLSPLSLFHLHSLFTLDSAPSNTQYTKTNTFNKSTRRTWNTTRGTNRTNSQSLHNPFKNPLGWHLCFGLWHNPQCACDLCVRVCVCVTPAANGVYVCLYEQPLDSFHPDPMWRLFLYNINQICMWGIRNTEETIQRPTLVTKWIWFFYFLMIYFGYCHPFRVLFFFIKI